MKKGIMICVIVLLECIMLSSCSVNDNSAGTSSNDSEALQSNTENIEELKVDYQSCSGYWSVDGQTHEEIIANGGTELFLEISDDNKLRGSFFTQQGTSERIAEINDITAEVVDGECRFSFVDDGWENSGTLYIQLLQDEVQIEVQNFVLSEDNTSGFGVSGTYRLIRTPDASEDYNLGMEGNDVDDLVQIDEFNSEDEIMEEIEKRQIYRDECSFYSEVVQYMENVREVRDISMLTDPLYKTDSEYYEENDFKDVPPLMIYLAKNEIYARHGYIFKNDELNNYFLGQPWYLPLCTSDEFDENVFNEYEQKNLMLLAEMDAYR